MRRLLKQARDERGAVLLTVLLMLAAMSAVAVGMMEEIRFDIRRTANIRTHDQAYWYALGLEAFAKNVIRASDEITPGRDTMLAPWARQPVSLPIDNGLIDASVRDAGNCFNLNSVVTEEEGRLETSELGLNQYIALLDALGFSDGDRRTLAYSLADWIDTDNTPGPRGAEDYEYSGRKPAYRTGGVLLADATELRAINGYTEEAYQRIRPYVCVLPSDTLSPINANMLRPEDAPLLVMLLGPDAIDLDRAQGIISNRPYEGYTTADEFWADEGFAGFVPGDALKEQVGIQTKFFDLRVQVALDDGFFAMNSLLERGNPDIRVVSRSFGLPE